MYSTLGPPLKIPTCGHLTKKYTSISWENSHMVRIWKGKPKKWYLNTVPKFYSLKKFNRIIGCMQ